MFCLKVVGKELYVPKTPYTQEEMENGYLTSKLERIGKYKHLGTIKNRLKELQPMYSEQLEII